MASDPIHAPLVIRGEVIEGGVEQAGRRGGARFTTPDARRYLDRLPLSAPSKMQDLYSLSFEDIVAYLEKLGSLLDFDRNRHLQAAYALSCETSGLSDSILIAQYRNIPKLFAPALVRESAENWVGIKYLEGWVEQPRSEGSQISVRIRAFGSRAVHIIAGNSPLIAVMTVIRNAITRSDAIIKTPSNDPLTATAIAQTMVEFAPDHPLTKHLSVAYWKGGDEVVESAIYDPRKIEKIVAWGGFAGIKHVTQYLQPGLDLITLDPKLSATIIGKQAFASEASMREVAARLALDVGSMNQEACVNARVVYVESGTDAPGLKNADRLGQLTYEALQKLPTTLSTTHKAFDANLRDEIDALRYSGDEYRLFVGRGSEGGVIVSQSDNPVDFSAMLGCRVANIVPVDDVATAVRSTNAYTQTIGIYPESLKDQLRDQLAYAGAQRMVSLGSAVPVAPKATPQDGIEPVRRMCKWITDETTDGQVLTALAGDAAKVGEPA